MKIGIMLSKSSLEEVNNIESTLKDLGLSVEQAYIDGLLTKRERMLIRMSEMQKTNPIDSKLVFG